MPKTWKRWRLYVVLGLFIASPTLIAASCFSKFEIPVNIKKSVDFDLDVDKYVKPALSKYNIPDSATTVPNGVPDIKIPVAFSQSFDISNEDAIKAVGSKITGAKVKSMLLEASANSLTAPLPGFSLTMGSKDSSAEPTQVVATLTSIPAGKVGTIEDLVKSGTQTSVIENYLLQFGFKFGIKADLVLKAGDTIPRGKAKLKMTFDLTVEVTPFK